MIKNLDPNTKGGVLTELREAVALGSALLFSFFMLAISSGDERAMALFLGGVLILAVVAILVVFQQKTTSNDENYQEEDLEQEFDREKENPASKEEDYYNSEDYYKEEKRSQLIEQALSEFGVPAKVVSVKRGPRLTQFGVEPGFTEKRERNGNVKRRKIKASTIYGLEDDLALALAVESVRLARVPGQSYIGLEVPNEESEIVPLTPILASASGALPIALGADVTGQPVTADITKMPHALIAGATNSGKSVCIHTILASLLSFGPEKVRLLLVDPKRVELVQYNGIGHLLEPVITDMEKAVGALKRQVQEMERRLELFSKVGKRNLESYNQWAPENAHRQLAYRVIILDELADLMMVHKEEVEPLLVRLAQMARATGIHLILATQRPTVDVVTGLIKANVPARISFAVASSTDSRVILDTNGAENLLGRGDGLYLAPDASEPVRMQGCFISDEELEALIKRWLLETDTIKPNPSSQTKTDVRDCSEHGFRRSETVQTTLREAHAIENDINDKQTESLTWNEVWPVVIELFHQTSQMERINMKTTKDAARSLGASIGREVWQGGTWRDITAAFTIYAQAHQKEDPQKEV